MTKNTAITMTTKILTIVFILVIGSTILHKCESYKSSKKLSKIVSNKISFIKKLNIVSQTLCYNSNHDYLHESMYPNDDYSHTLGYSDSSHKPSKLQEITIHTLKNVARNKLPIDTDGCGIDRTFYVSESDMVEEIREFDLKYGKPLHLGKK